MWYLSMQFLKNRNICSFQPKVLNNRLSINNVIRNTFFTKFTNNNIIMYTSRVFLKNNNSWSLEILFKFGVNNTYIIFSNPIVQNLLVYKLFYTKEWANKQLNKKLYREMLFGFTTGRCGFTQSQKRSAVAVELTLSVALWFCKRVYKLLNGIKLRFLGRTKFVFRYFNGVKRFSLGNRLVKIYSITDVTPSPYNGVRCKSVGRKRYRFHKYSYRRVLKIKRRNVKTVTRVVNF